MQRHPSGPFFPSICASQTLLVICQPRYLLWRFAGGEDCEALNHRAEEEPSDTPDGSPLYHRLSESFQSNNFT